MLMIWSAGQQLTPTHPPGYQVSVIAVDKCLIKIFDAVGFKMVRARWVMIFDGARRALRTRSACREMKNRIMVCFALVDTNDTVAAREISSCWSNGGLRQQMLVRYAVGIYIDRRPRASLLGEMLSILSAGRAK